jgi:hypothetical protein
VPLDIAIGIATGYWLDEAKVRFPAPLRPRFLPSGCRANQLHSKYKGGEKGSFLRDKVSN